MKCVQNTSLSAQSLYREKLYNQLCEKEEFEELFWTLVRDRRKRTMDGVEAEGARHAI